MSTVTKSKSDVVLEFPDQPIDSGLMKSEMEYGNEMENDMADDTEVDSFHSENQPSGEGLSCDFRRCGNVGGKLR